MPPDLDLFGTIEASAPPAQADALLDEFQRWYRAYPRRKKPGAAERAYRKARKRATAAELLVAAERFALERAGKDPEFTPYPATWLNARSWLDEPDLPAQPAGRVKLSDDEAERIVARLRDGRHRLERATVADFPDSSPPIAAPVKAPKPPLVPDPYMETVKADRAEFAAWCEARRAAGLSDSYRQYLIERAAKGTDANANSSAEIAIGTNGTIGTPVAIGSDAPKAE